MELVNTIQEGKEQVVVSATGQSVLRSALETTVILLSPVVPHMADALWEDLGHSCSLLEVPWPLCKEEATEEDQILIVVQVNGKVRSRFHVSPDADEDTVKTAALTDERIIARLAGRPVKKIIVVKNKLVNIVV
jgi:leucyl-tRNA synthetase